MNCKNVFNIGNLSASCLSLCILLGCQSTGNFVVNDKYGNMDLSRKWILISPLPHDVVAVENKDDVADDFENDTRESEVVIQDSLYRKMNQHAAGSLGTGKFLDLKLPFDLFPSQVDTSQFSSIKLPIRIADRDTVLSFLLPHQAIIPSEHVDVVVIINKVRIGRNIDGSNGFSAPTYVAGTTVSTPGGSFSTPGMWMGGGGGGGASSYLGATVKFIIWDYENNAPISYGIANVRKGVNTGCTINDWNSLFESVIEKVFEGTTFKWKYPKWSRLN